MQSRKENNKGALRRSLLNATDGGCKSAYKAEQGKLTEGSYLRTLHLTSVESSESRRQRAITTVKRSLKTGGLCEPTYNKGIMNLHTSHTKESAKGKEVDVLKRIHDY